MSWSEGFGPGSAARPAAVAGRKAPALRGWEAGFGGSPQKAGGRWAAAVTGHEAPARWGWEAGFGSGSDRRVTRGAPFRGRRGPTATRLQSAPTGVRGGGCRVTRGPPPYQGRRGPTASRLQSAPTGVRGGGRRVTRGAPLQGRRGLAGDGRATRLLRRRLRRGWAWGVGRRRRGRGWRLRSRRRGRGAP